MGLSYRAYYLAVILYHFLINFGIYVFELTLQLIYLMTMSKENFDYSFLYK